MENNKTKSKNHNIFISLLICVVLVPLFTVLWIFYGPFETARRVWICTAMSTAEHKYLATAFFSNDTIDYYTSQYFNSISDLPQQDVNMIKPSSNRGNIRVEDVSVGLARGKLMIIPDPSMVDIAVCNYLGNSGMTLEHLLMQENASSGINAGAYSEKEGSSHGSVPGGIIVKGGEIIYFEETSDESICVIGFDYDNLLTVAYVESKEEVVKLNLRCAVSFGPPLIINGEGLIETSSTSLQPRTAIAQREDGSVLFLVLDGRQPSSAGATLMQVQELLLEKGAITAANLDGGSSAAMIHNGELLNSPSDNKELKKIPTAFIVKE